MKYAVPGRGLQRRRRARTARCVVGGLLGVVGFFVVPVVGLVLGFVLGVYLSELQRVGHASAPGPRPGPRCGRPACRCSIELAAGLLAAAHLAGRRVVREAS